MRKFTGTKLKKSGGASSKSNARSRKPDIQVAVCLRPKGRVDVRAGQLYKVIPDREAKRRGCIRVVDDSGEDYLYPASDFKVSRLSEIHRMTWA